MKIKSSKSKSSKVKNFLLNKNKRLNWLYIAIIALSVPGSIKLIHFGLTKISETCYPNNKKALLVFQCTRLKLFGYRQDTLNLDIKFKDFKKLEFKRNKAKKIGVLQTEEDDFVKAKIRIGDLNYKAKVRLKGDWADHLDGDRWSYRVKLKGDKRLFGMKKFSLQEPKTRNHINEWVYHKLLKKENIPSLRYLFLPLKVNGNNHGIYALEEHFDKILIENNQFKEGPIVKLSEALYWDNEARARKIYKTYKFPKDICCKNPINVQLNTQVEVFKEEQILTDPNLNIQFQKAAQLLEGFYKNKLTTSLVFDINKLSIYLAINDLTNGQHGSTWHNYRFYYNPIISKLIPIGFDAMPGEATGKNPLSKIMIEKNYADRIMNFFQDEELIKAYISQLERISKKNYLDNFFLEIKEEYENNLKILGYNIPFINSHLADFKSLLYINQKIIQDKLNPKTPLNIYLNDISQNQFNLDIGNKQLLPIEIVAITYDKNTIYRPEEKIVIGGIKKSEYISYRNLTIPINSQSESNIIFNPKSLIVSYRLLGSKNIQKAKVFAFPRPKGKDTLNDLVRQESNIKEFPFLIVDKIEKKIFIKTGTWIIDKPLIVPKDFTLIGAANTKIILKNKGLIISKSPINLRGKKDSPIVISATQSGQGIAVLNTRRNSYMEYVHFDGLRNPADQLWNLTGAITFYNSPIEISNCIFSNIKAEDSINIVKSKFSFKNSQIIRSKSDSIDLDFSDGIIENISIIDAGNDGIDISGSNIKMNYVSIDGAKDKAFSVGEEANIEASNVEIKNAEIAFASKDKSTIIADSILVANSKVGFVVFQKKPEYGSASMNISNGSIQNVETPYLLEPNSDLTINEKKYTTNVENVESLLYGVKYGKKSD